MNVIFDLGGVVVTWNPTEIIEASVSDEAIRPAVRKAVFDHPDWVELDRGTLDPDLAMERAAGRAGVPLAQIERVMEEVSRYLVPMPASVELVREVRAAGHKVLALSNMHARSIDFLERTHSILRNFDAATVSCRVGLVKPDPAIYRHVLSEHGLNPSETVFIDDTEVNVTAASGLGIRTILFESVPQCRKLLESLGCL